ncbi:MAG TPA: hypothetical protein VLJ15_04440 [Gammaproteobacteria bacterium]|nr:hypothetical protein [Gammaproteobacteria bacterium]
MSTQQNQTSNGIYLFNPAVSFNQLFEAVNASLCKAHAIAAIGAVADMDVYDADIVNNYLWALSDIIQEAKWLHGKIISCKHIQEAG